jgi:hypothetical protein
MYANHGIKATTASKGSTDGAEFTPITRDGEESATAFCKRKIRWCEEKGRYVSCLSLDSLACMLIYTDNNLREYQEVLDTWYKEMSRRGKADFNKYAPSVTRIAAEKYNYISIYSDYDIALMATVDGASNTHCRKVFAALENSELSRDELLSLEEWKSSDKNYEIELPVGCSPHADFNADLDLRDFHARRGPHADYVRMAKTETRSSFSAIYTAAQEYANPNGKPNVVWTARRKLCLELQSEVKAYAEIESFISEDHYRQEVTWRLRFCVKEPSFAAWARQRAEIDDINLEPEIEMPICCEPHADFNYLVYSSEEDDEPLPSFFIPAISTSVSCSSVSYSAASGAIEFSVSSPEYRSAGSRFAKQLHDECLDFMNLHARLGTKPGLHQTTWYIEQMERYEEYVDMCAQMRAIFNIPKQVVPIACNPHSDEVPYQISTAVSNTSNVTLMRLAWVWATLVSIILLARNYLELSTMAESKHHEQVVLPVDGLIENITIIEPHAEFVPSVSLEVHETTAFTTDGTTKETHPSDIPKPLNYRGDQSDIRSWLARPFLLATPSWTNVATNLELVSFNVETILNTMTPWKNKLSGFQLWRGTAVITLQMNASPFQAGRLLLHYMPCYSGELDALNVNLMQKTMHPHVEFDCRDTEVQLRIPYIAPTSYNDPRTNFGWGNFYVTVLSSLRYGTTAPVDVSVSVWMHFEDFEVAGPIPIVAYADEVRSEPRHISKTLKAAGKIAGSLSSVPSIGPIMGMTALAADVASKAAYTLGYSKPVDEQTPEPVFVVNNRFAATSDGTDSAMPLSLSAQNRIQQIPMSIRNVDEMSIAYLSHVQSYWQSVTWNTSQATGVSLITLPIGPRLFVSPGSFSVGAHTVTVQTQHPIAMLGDLTAFYRGGIDVTFKIIKTQFHTGRLDFQFTPGDFGVDSYQDIGLMREILDISVSDEITIKMPYLTGQNYLDFNSKIGTLKLKVLNKLRAPETASDNVDILIYIRGGKDFEVQGVIPSGGGYPVVCTPHSEESLPVEVVGSQDDKDLGVAFSSMSIGEHIMSLKQLINRYSVVNNRSTTISSTTGLAVYPWTFGGFSIDTTGAKIAPRYGGDILGRIAPCYRFFKGSMHVGVMPGADGISASQVPNHIRMALVPYNAYNVSDCVVAAPTDIVTGNIDWTLSQPKNTGIGVAVTPARDGMFYAKVPYFSDFHFSLVTPNLSNVPIVAGAQPLTSVVIEYNQIIAEYYSYLRAAGDDFRFGFFIATPPLYVSST